MSHHSLGGLGRSALSFAVGVALLLGVVGVLVPQYLLPRADAAPGCFQDPGPDRDDDYGSMSLQEENGGSTQTTLSGVRADVLVGADAVPCGRINSVYVASPNFNNLMEFGWAKGWLSCHGNPGSYTQYGNAIPFAVGVEPGPNGDHCRHFSGVHPSPGNFHTFRASDSDENSFWGSWLDGNEMQPDGWSLQFTQGVGGINAERQNPQDNGFAHFDQIEENINGTWSITNDLGDRYDTDPDYHFNYVNQHHVKFSHD